MNNFGPKTSMFKNKPQKIVDEEIFPNLSEICNAMQKKLLQAQKYNGLSRKFVSKFIFNNIFITILIKLQLIRFCIILINL